MKLEGARRAGGREARWEMRETQQIDFKGEGSEFSACYGLHGLCTKNAMPNPVETFPSVSVLSPFPQQPA